MLRTQGAAASDDVGDCSFAEKYGSKPYSHPAITSVIVEMWFGRGKIGAVHFDELKYIPISMIAVKVSSVEYDGS
jgi:hypothetical protein